MSLKNLRLMLLGVAALAAVVFSAWLVIVALSTSRPAGEAAEQTAPTTEAARPEPKPEPRPEEKPAPPADPRLALAAKIAETPQIARFFDALKRALPTEYAAALESLARAPASDNPDLWLSEAVKSLRQSRGAAAARAEPALLGAIFARQLAVLDALAMRDPAMCVDFLYGGASPAIFSFAADNRALISDLAIAGLDAIVDGEQKNIVRKPPNEADFQMLEKALTEKGLDKPEIEALLDGKTPDPPLPSDKMCAAGRAYLQTLATLPEESRLRIYSLAVELMARS